MGVSWVLKMEQTRWFLGARDAGFRETFCKWCRWWQHVEPLFPPSFCISAHDVLLGRRPLRIGVDAVHKELVRGVIQQQLLRLRYLIQSASGQLDGLQPDSCVWCHQRLKSGLAKRVTASISHNRLVMVDPRSIPVSVVQASGPSLSEANLYEIPTFHPYMYRSTPLHQGWST